MKEKQSTDGDGRVKASGDGRSNGVGIIVSQEISET